MGLLPDGSIVSMHAPNVSCPKRSQLPNLGMQLYKEARGVSLYLRSSFCIAVSHVQPASTEVLWSGQVFIEVIKVQSPYWIN